jgi:hypothetical protein
MLTQIFTLIVSGGAAITFIVVVLRLECPSLYGTMEIIRMKNINRGFLVTKHGNSLLQCTVGFHCKIVVRTDTGKVDEAKDAQTL